jgi:hypothetical protein
MRAKKDASLKQGVRKAVERKRSGPPAKRRRRKFPILDSKQPGSLRLTNTQIEDLLA